MEKIRKYLEEKGIQIDVSRLKYIENGTDISEKDEYTHNFGTFPPHHNESWYFNFIDRPNNVFFITRLSFEMYEKKSQLMLVLVANGKIYTYYKNLPLEAMPDNWEFDNKLKYYCIKPMNQWKVTYEDKKIQLEVDFSARFPVCNYLTNENPLDALEKYGVEILDLAAQQHYEQSMYAKGKVILKKAGESKEIDCLGHRDHSWGTRDWVGIDRWNWISAQFEDEAINIANVEFLGKKLQNGFISTKDGNIAVKKIEVTTKTKEDGKTPVSSTFEIVDAHGKIRKVTSNTIFSLHMPLPATNGLTEIFEQVVTFEYEGKEGDGISEYLISTRP